MRGLLHTFARALWGPLLGGDPTQVFAAETKLFGAAGGRESSPPTFRLQDISSGNLGQDQYPNRPGEKKKGMRAGFRPGQRRTIAFRPRRYSIEGTKAVPSLVAMLWATAWAAFSFGGIGIRSRRGYGSLTVEAGTSLPELGAGPLPLFESVPADPLALRRDLHRGLNIVRQTAYQWLMENGFSPDLKSGCPPYPFFQIAGPEQIYVGPGEEDRGADARNDNALVLLMDACSKALDTQPQLFKRSLGGANPRLASPLWVRFYRTEKGLVPVATFSPLVEEQGLARKILTELKATPLQSSEGAAS
ncbi:MAG: hypothetical protein M3O15_03055 [Acidobacteriota bacterium]|nr:hypothetical protein [Acidobacteriota bacterium]